MITPWACRVEGDGEIVLFVRETHPDLLRRIAALDPTLVVSEEFTIGRCAVPPADV